MSEYNDNSPVMAYYCKCGKSIECAGDPKRFDRKSWTEYGKMEKEGRKVETITLAEFHKIPFMCSNIDCPDKTKTTHP